MEQVLFGIDFKNPEFLLLVPILAGAIYFFIRNGFQYRGSGIGISSASLVTTKSSIRVRTYRYLYLFRVISIFFLIIALARPGKSLHYTSVKKYGIDIMIVLDVSDSMMGEDFQPNNRLYVAKNVIRDFIEKRENDRIGLVVFSGEAYLHCPLSLEYDLVKEIIGQVDFDSVQEDGTSIGEALALACSRMMEGAAKSKIILLLTDGVNNRGDIDPETAAQMCAELGIRIYTVGIGSKGKVPARTGKGLFRFKHYLDNHFDEKMLQEISIVTGGTYYRATSSGVLWEKIKDIDRLEKSVIESKKFDEYRDRFQIFLLLAMAFFFLETALRSLYYRKVP